MVSPRSPGLSSKTTHPLSRHRQPLPDAITQHSTDDTEISSSSPEQARPHPTPISIIPIGRHSSRSRIDSRRGHHPTMINPTDSDHHYFSPTQLTQSRTPLNFRKKVHGIYVLPVSPTLSSSSSSMTTADEKQNHGSNTMPIRSRRSINVSRSQGIKNQSFDESPQPKGRTLPRLHGQTLKTLPPSQPPPDPPFKPSINLDPSRLELRFCKENIYGTTDDCLVNKSTAPPVPCRAQKPTLLPIGFQEFTSRNEKIGFRSMVESSPNDDSSEHTWPKPPESMTTSQISGHVPAAMPPMPLSPSIPYDRLHHDHLIPTVILRQHTMTNFIQFPLHTADGEHSMLTESDS